MGREVLIGAVLGYLAELGCEARRLSLPASDIGAPHTRFHIFILTRRTVSHSASLRRRPRRGESLDRVRKARHDCAIPTAHRLALDGPAGSRPKWKPKLLWSLIGQLFDTGDATPWQSDGGTTSPDEKPLTSSPERRRPVPLRRMAHGPLR